MQGQYPVIFIDFKDCKATGYNDVKSKLQNKLFEIVSNFSYLKNSKRRYKVNTVGEEYDDLFCDAKSDHFTFTLKNLS